MLNSFYTTPELNANLVNFDKVQDLLGTVLIELIRRDFSQEEGAALSLLDQRQIEKRLNRVIRATMRKANPGVKISTLAKIDWMLYIPAKGRPFFYGDVYIDVDDREFNKKVQQLLPLIPAIGYYQ